MLKIEVARVSAGKFGKLRKNERHIATCVLDIADVSLLKMRTHRSCASSTHGLSAGPPGELVQRRAYT